MTTISVDTTLTQSLFDSYSSPITINEGVTVTLSEYINNSNSTKYFIIGGTNITFEGNKNAIILDSMVDYPGLFQCTVPTYTATIQNLGVLAYETSTLATNSAWFVQGYATSDAIGDSGITVKNCYSTGEITSNSGCIFGKHSNGIAIDCYSTGKINPNAGGIFGPNSSGTATNCYSVGTFDENAGGIFGSNSTGTASNCYSTGFIAGVGAGGIFGSSSSGIANNCYSTGAITGIGAGGVFANSCSGTANSCYSTGPLSDGAYGISGINSTCTENNCFSANAPATTTVEENA
jgi:hypothetical protein